jgi:hypothetical protein
MALITRQAAAVFLSEQGYPISAATLAKHAVHGGGCPYRVWNNRAVYDTTDLLAWAESRVGPKLHSTAERQPQAKASSAPGRYGPRDADLERADPGQHGGVSKRSGRAGRPPLPSSPLSSRELAAAPTAPLLKGSRQ